MDLDDEIREAERKWRVAREELERRDAELMRLREEREAIGKTPEQRRREMVQRTQEISMRALSITGLLALWQLLRNHPTQSVAAALTVAASTIAATTPLAPGSSDWLPPDDERPAVVGLLPKPTTGPSATPAPTRPDLAPADDDTTVDGPPPTPTVTHSPTPEPTPTGTDPPSPTPSTPPPTPTSTPTPTPTATATPTHSPTPTPTPTETPDRCLVHLDAPRLLELCLLGDLGDDVGVDDAGLLELGGLGAHGEHGGLSGDR